MTKSHKKFDPDDTKYLSKRSERWFFTKRVGDKRVVIALKTGDLEEAQRRRDEVLKLLPAPSEEFDAKSAVEKALSGLDDE